MIDYNLENKVNKLQKQLQCLYCEVKNGGGGSGIEVDPIFKASPAYTITDLDKSYWSDKNYNNLTNLPNLNLKADLISGKVPASQLPSYVDDVIEYNTLSDFPNPGETGKIYIAKNTNKTYRWSGSTYIDISQNSSTTLQQVTEAGNTTTRSIIASSFILPNPYSGYTFTITSDNVGEDIKVEPPGQSGMLVVAPDLNQYARYADTAHGQVTFIAKVTGKVDVITGDDNLKWDDISKRLDVSKVKIFNLSQGNYPDYPRTVVAKEDGTLGYSDNSPQLVTTNASTYTLIPTKRTIHVGFYGTTTEFILPPIANNAGTTLLLFNAGTSDVTIRTSDGNTMYDGMSVLTNNTVLTSGSPMTIFSPLFGTEPKWVTKP